MVRPLVVQGSPTGSRGLAATAGDGSSVTLTWSRAALPADRRSPTWWSAPTTRASAADSATFRTAAGATSFTDDHRAESAHLLLPRADRVAAGYSPWSATADVSLP